MRASGLIITVFIVPMRNWNIRYVVILVLTFEFLSYLWGIETKSRWISWHTWLLFLSYLWGIETHFCHPPFIVIVSFYRTYEELKLKPPFLFQASCPSFYRTYEELKLFKKERISRTGLSVFIVPMRNWNSGSDLLLIILFTFLSYLWGIETSKRNVAAKAGREFLSYLWGIETWPWVPNRPTC